MIIRNVSNASIEFTNLRDRLADGARFILLPGQESTVFNQDAERDPELGAHVIAGRILVISDAEPFIEETISEVDTTPANLRPGTFGGTPSDLYTFPTDVRINSNLTVSGVITAGSTVSLDEPIVRSDIFQVINPGTHVYQLTHGIIPETQMVYMNGVLMREGYGFDYVMDDNRVVIDPAWVLTTRDVISVKYKEAA
jgi:hypothetical protein